jgi:O-antigen/teichoic acid export membrane protein
MDARQLRQAVSVSSVDPARVDPGIADLRHHTARGTLINSGFQVGLSGLGMLQRVIVAAFLTRAEYGVWGVLVASLFAFVWLRDVGIGDKYIQQSEPDQEAAFQKAFTLELIVSLGFFVVAAVGLPVWAAAYGHSEIVAPGILTALAVPIQAFEAPALIAYRRLEYARQRTLTAVNPVVTFAVTVGLAIAGAGYWCFVWGALAGAVGGGLVCTITSPYRLRLRLDRGTAREYASFSWPLVGAGLSNVVSTHGSLLVANQVVGLAGIGAIGLATGIALFAERVDAIVSQTIYPAVCAVAHRRELLAEAFTKSNKLALIWAIPFGVALALFADDLVTFALGDRWRPAVGLLIAFGLTVALGHVAFNWQIFLRAVNRTRPIFVSAVLDVVVFLGVGIPAMLAFGLGGYAAGFAASTFVQVVLRGYYMRQLFAGFHLLPQLARGLAPTAPAASLILLLRALTDIDRSLVVALAELSAYSIAVIALTFVLERSLLGEAIGYLRGKWERVPGAQSAGLTQIE